jgi:hypothetical protein
VERAVQVELEAEVVRAARYFRHINGDCLADPRAELAVEDGRNYLLACREPFDVVISEPSNPWMPGVANLFSVESFRLLKEKTATPGVVCQWLQVYNMDPRDVKMILRGFHTVFPAMALFHTTGGNLLMIGFNGPVALDPARAEAALAANPALRARLEGIGLSDACALWEWSWIGDGRALGPYWEGEGPLNTDDRPVLEARAAARIYRDWARRIYEDLRARATPLPLERWLPDPGRRAGLYAALAQLAADHADTRRAEDYWRKARALGPGPGPITAPRPSLSAAETEYQAAVRAGAEGKLDEELRLLQGLERRRYFRPEVYARLAELDLAGGAWEPARGRLLVAVCMDPLAPAPHRLLSEAYARLGNLRLAQVEQDRYLELIRK